MPDLWPLLVSDPLDGDTLVNRQLRPGACAVPIDRVDFSAACRAVVDLCSAWGGGSMLLMPVTPGASVEPRWAQILLESNIDGIKSSDVLDRDEIRKYSDIQGTYTQLLLRMLVDLEHKPVVQTCRGVSEEDPWHLAYLALLGDLPTGPDQMNTWNDLAARLTYQDVLTIRGIDSETGATGLLASMRDYTTVSAVDLTRTRLSVGLQASYNKGLLPETSRFQWDLGRVSRQYGPNIVVVYEPGSVEDLALIWNLRARFAHPNGLPLAIPHTANTEEDLRTLTQSGAEHYFGAGHNLALASFSVSMGDLENIGRPQQFEVVDPWRLLGPIHGYCAVSTDTVHFTGGVATIADFSPTDIQAVGLQFLGRHQGTWMRLKTTVADNPLPPSRTMRRAYYFGEVHYLDGQITTGGKLGGSTVIRHPTGLEVLSAIVADAGLTATESEPGRAAEQLMRTAGNRLSMFASPGVAASFVELTRGRNVSLVKRRLNQFLDQTNLDESTDRYQLLFDRLDDAVGPPDIDEVGYVAFDRLRNLLRMSPAAAQRWARWAIASDLILRGVEASCKRCGHKQWRPLAEVIPSLICHGCGHKIDNPHGFNHIEYRYRASESLLRAMSHDVLPCLLAIRYISSTLGGKDGMVFGAYPGIELRQPGSTRVEAELDVLVVLRNGGLVVGECKTNARGLTPEELTKLWTAADQLDARATFAATLDRGSNCQSEWRHQTAPNGRPHFALTAEHLFDLNTRGPTADTDLFDWRDDYSLGPEADVDKAFNDYIERTGNDNEQLLRAPWMTKDD